MKRGFTLIELVVVIGILAILSMILLPNVINYIDRSKSVTCLKNIEYATREITAQKHLDKDFDETSFIASHKICPSDGTISVSHSNKLVIVRCDKHSENDKVIGDANANVQEMFEAVKKCQALANNNDKVECLKSNGFEPGNINNEKFRKAYLEKYGGFEQLSSELMSLLGYTTTQYYQPYYDDKSNDMFMYAGTCSDNKCQGAVVVTSIFYNGQWYQKADNSEINIKNIKDDIAKFLQENNIIPIKKA